MSNVKPETINENTTDETPIFNRSISGGNGYSVFDYDIIADKNLTALIEILQGEIVFKNYYPPDGNPDLIHDINYKKIYFSKPLQNIPYVTGLIVDVDNMAKPLPNLTGGYTGDIHIAEITKTYIELFYQSDSYTDTATIQYKFKVYQLAHG